MGHPKGERVRVQLAAMGCVALIALGQIVFKTAADAGTSAGTFMAPRPLAIAFAAFAIYGATTVLWMLLLQRAPISKVYPFMGLSFVILPVAAYFLFGEALTARQLVGSVVIAGGVVIAASA